MRKTALIACALAITTAGFAQTATKSAPKTATKSGAQKSAASAKKPAVPAPAATPGKNPTAVIHTSAGDLTCELYKDKVPNAVDNFVGLATGTKDWTDPKSGQKKHGVPLYDGTIFHRVIPEFMIQGGDPMGSGMGNAGYRIPDEYSPDLHFDKGGVLAYANSGPNTNSSQFFVTEQPTSFLDPCLDDAGCIRGNRQVRKGAGYTIFGQCTPESVELVKKIAREPRGAQDMPNNPVSIKHIDISGVAAAKPAAPAKKAPTKTGAKKAAPKQKQ
jgi:peptidyl-prolyl cis-trans isomerase A (cyclophilin A)